MTESDSETIVKKKMIRPTPIAIVGMGCMFPKANDPEVYWANINNCVDGITGIPETHWRPEDYYNADPAARDQTYAKRGGFIEPIQFNPMEYGISPRDLEAIDTTQLLGLVVAKQALKDAGYDEDSDFDRSRTSVILGVTGALELVVTLSARLGHPNWRNALKDAGVDPQLAADVMARISDSYVDWQENSFPGLLGNVVAGRIANRLNLGGTNCVVDAACASSLTAMHLASLELSSGRNDIVVTGGMDTFNDIFMYMCFSKTPALSPTGDSKPFDHEADGTILGEGIGVVVLKRLEDAQRDNDRIYSVIRGVGSSSDGKGDAVYAPSSEGQTRALRQAYELADISPDTIELVEAHGTGTKVGDAIEARALSDLYRESGRADTWCALGSVKSQIGHTKAAAGIAGLIKASLALYHKVLPPTMKVTRPLEVVQGNGSPFYLNTTKRPWMPSIEHPRRAGVSSFGFGGSNFHCVLEEADDRKPCVDWDGEIQLLVFTGDSRAEISGKLDNWLGYDEPWRAFRHKAAESRRAYDGDDNCRLIFVVQKGASNLAKSIGQAKKILDDNSSGEHWSTPDGVYFGTGVSDGQIGVLFPGQGSQYVGMFRDLACHFPQMQEALAAANAVFSEHEAAQSGKRLTDIIFPFPEFDDDEITKNESALRDTRVAQPAIGAVCMGLFSILQDFGLKPHTVAGHSYGELPALCASGRFGATTLHALSNLRGQLMAAKHSYKGTMLAVKASGDQVLKLIKSAGLDLVVANKNGPEQIVLSGAEKVIDKAAGLFSQMGIGHKLLKVSSAFHSAWVSHAREPFSDALQKIKFSAAKIPVYANSTAQPYPNRASQIRELLAGQLARPVEFMDQITNMYGAGVRTFVEVGPGYGLTGLVSSILKGKDFTAFATDSSAGKRSGFVDLGRTLAHLASLGIPVQLDKWDNIALPDDIGTKPGFAVSLCGANYVNKASQAKEEPFAKSSAAALMLTADPTRQSASEIADRQTSNPNSNEINRPRVKTPSNPAPSPTVPDGVPALATSGAATMASSDALRITQQNMLALQKLQTETAKLHQQFLNGQEHAHENMRVLIQQQQQILSGSYSFTESPRVNVPDIPMSLEMPANSEAAKPSHDPTNAVSDTEAVSPRSEKHDVILTENSAQAGYIEKVLLEIVADKTGYPEDILNLEMNLDADLGIDSIKRVEILSALQERMPELPPIGAEQLGSIQTLEQIVEFLQVPKTADAASELAHLESSGPAQDLIASTLLEVVADKTGYPLDILTLDMGLDADLGIDSIKRVEILSALQERLPGTPGLGPEHLGQIQTLAQIIEFLQVAPTPVTTDNNAVSSQPSSAREKIAATLLEVVADKTGYPLDILTLEMGLDADLGIDSIKRVEILSALQEQLLDTPSIGPEHLGQLQSLEEIVDYLSAKNGDSSTDAPTSPPVKAEGPVRSLQSTLDDSAIDRHIIVTEKLEIDSNRQRFQLSAGARIMITDDGAGLAKKLFKELRSEGYDPEIIGIGIAKDIKPPPYLDGLVILTPLSGAGNNGYLNAAFSLIKRFGPALRASGQSGGALLATVSRLDGAFGLHKSFSKSDPISGGLAGLSKTLLHEWPEVHCKAIDLDSSIRMTEKLVKSIVEEIFTAGPVEVGISSKGRVTLSLLKKPLNGKASGLKISSDDVILVSGGARGVTAETALSIANAWQASLLLVGRSPEPSPEPDWLVPLADEASIKKALLGQSETKITPKEINVKFHSLMANREILRNLKRIEAAGSRVVYRSLDIRDRKAVQSMVEEVTKTIGEITGLVHGAGVIADKRIEDKTEEQFNLVYSTKVEGQLSLLAALEQKDIKFMVFFSSSTGRFGRTGQIDYAAANEVLNKLAQQEARNRPGCRILSLNWGPWAGGMVTPALKGVFEREGVGLIPLKAGSDYMVKELLSASSEMPVEVVVVAAGSRIQSTSNSPAAISSAYKLVVEENLSLTSHTYLASHIFGGEAVLPMSIMIEWLAHSAMHGNPGLKFAGIDNLEINSKLALTEDEQIVIRLKSANARKENDHYVVPIILCRVKGDLEIIHAKANVILTSQLTEDSLRLDDSGFKPYSGHPIPYDGTTLFHGKHFFGIKAIERLDENGFTARCGVAPAPAKWITSPLRNRWLADPLVLDCAFQLMIVWAVETQGIPSLPLSVKSYRQFTNKFPADGCRITAAITGIDGPKATAEIEISDSDGMLVARIEGYTCILDPSLADAFRQNTLTPLPCGT